MASFKLLDVSRRWASGAIPSLADGPSGLGFWACGGAAVTVEEFGASMVGMSLTAGPDELFGVESFGPVVAVAKVEPLLGGADLWSGEARWFDGPVLGGLCGARWAVAVAEEGGVRAEEVGH